MRETLCGFATVLPLFVAKAVEGNVTTLTVGAIVVSSLVTAAVLTAHWGL